MADAKVVDTMVEEVATEAVKAESNEIVSNIKNEFGSISENTKFVGDIETEGHLAIAGTVIGNISANGNIIITGTVEGNIECDNIILDGCSIKSDIKANGNVQVKAETHIVGSLVGNDFAILGSVVGNINASGQVILYKSSAIDGDITAKELGAEPGAKISGKIKIG